MKKILPILILITTSILKGQCWDTSLNSGRLDINNVNTKFTLPASLFNGSYSNNYEVPKGSGKHALAMGSIWMGGIDDIGQLKLAAQTYGQNGHDFFPGPLDNEGNIIAEACENFNFAWEVTNTEIHQFIQSGYNQAYLTNNIKNWPGRNNPLFDMFELPYDLDLAPFNDNNGDGIYNPLDGDTPLCKGNQNFWWVFNDKAQNHTETGGNQLGVQIAAYAYALVHENALQNTTFWEFDVTNKSGLNLFDYYFGFFIDVNLGNFQDDYVGCIPDMNIAYAYNGDDFDDGTAGYGEEIPIVGIEILEGVKNEGIDTKMSHFISYHSGFNVQSEPTNPEQYYNYLQAKWRDGSPLVKPGTNGDGYGDGQPTNYMFNATPTEALPAWSECSVNKYPGNRRFLASSGPGQLSNGQTQNIKMAVYWVPNVPHPCPDVDEYFQESSYWGNTVVNYFDFLSNAPTINQNLIKLSPNPAKHQISFNVEHEFFDQLEIHNLNGQLIQSHQGFTKQLNIANLPNGQYLISFIKNEQTTAAKKVIILK